MHFTFLYASIATPPGGFLRRRFSLKILDPPPPKKKRDATSLSLHVYIHKLFISPDVAHVSVCTYVQSHASVCAVDVDFAMLQVTGSQCL